MVTEHWCLLTTKGNSCLCPGPPQSGVSSILLMNQAQEDPGLGTGLSATLAFATRKESLWGIVLTCHSFSVEPTSHIGEEALTHCKGAREWQTADNSG